MVSDAFLEKHGLDHTYGYSEERFVRLVANMRHFQKLAKEDAKYWTKCLEFQVKVDNFITDYMKPLQAILDRKKIDEEKLKSKLQINATITKPVAIPNKSKTHYVKTEEDNTVRIG